MEIILDIETNLSHSKIWMCCTRELETGLTKTWKEPTEELRAYLKGASKIIGHNVIAFDAPILNRLWKMEILLSQCFDTLLVSRLIDPAKEAGHSLKAWGKELGEEKIDYEEWENPDLDVMETYCLQDTSVTLKLYHKLQRDIKKLGFSDRSIEIEHECGCIIAEMVDNGFKLDTVQATLLLVDLQGRKAALVEWTEQRWPTTTYPRFHKTSGKPLKDGIVAFNIGSRQQIGEKLKELGWKPDKFTEKGQPIVDESVLSKLPYEEAKKIAEYLLVQKRISQIESWMEVIGNDGRVHGKVITNGAITGRATHSSPNMGQVPAARSEYGPDCRKCWTVEDGNVLVGCDLSGIELRCFAHYLKDDDYTNEVVNGDVHTRNQHAFGVASRDLAKTILYATLYGASSAKVGKILGKTAKEGEKIISNFEASVPAYAKLKKRIDVFAAKKSLPGLDGRKLQIRSDHAALNTLLQSAGAIIAKQWLISLTKALRLQGIPYKLVAWVHDEVQIETKEQYGDQVGKIVVEAAAEAGRLLEFRCPVAAEYKVGKNWYDCH